MPMTRRQGHHRFQAGDHVYLRPSSHAWLDEAFVVLKPKPHHGWPHYELLAPDGSIWSACQLELLSKPLPQRHV